MPDGLVRVGGHDYTLYRGQTFEESQKVDAIIDRYEELSVAPPQNRLQSKHEEDH